MALKFEWDDVKASANLRKPQVSFEESKTVFNDPFLMTFPDPDHSDGEQRYFSVGQVCKRANFGGDSHGTRGECPNDQLPQSDGIGTERL